MINDLPNVVSTAECLMFADDLKLFLGIEHKEDCEALQRDIDAVVAWSERNKLEFNAGKCKTITFTRSRSPLKHNYTISGVPLERVKEIRDLGLLLDVELTFNKHITQLCNQTYKSLGFVTRQSARFCDRNTILTLYYAYVRSKLEYNSIIWDPHDIKYKLMIEKVQKKFGRYLYKRLYGYYPYLYPSLFVCGMVGINTLELRRKCAILMHYFLLLNGNIDDPPTLSRCSLSVPEQLRWIRSRRLFATPVVRTRTAQHAPTTQALNMLNALITWQPDTDLFLLKKGQFIKFCKVFISVC